MNNNTLYLSHHGILGQKWGVRRYQNKDGSLTQAGKSRYGDEITLKEANKRTVDRNRSTNHAYKEVKKKNKAQYKATGDKAQYKADKKAAKKEYKAQVARNSIEAKKDMARVSNRSIIGTGVTYGAAGAAAYGVGTAMGSDSSTGAFVKSYGKGMLVGGAVTTATNLGAKYLARAELTLASKKYKDI